MSPRATGGVINHIRVPTALERKGDFSQSIDVNGAPANLIRDATTGLPCTAADTSGCFADGGVLGRIPKDRLYSLGLAVLNRWPMPNASGSPNFNLTTVQPKVPYNTYQTVARVDYQLSDKIRITAAGRRRCGHRSAISAITASTDQAVLLAHSTPGSALAQPPVLRRTASRLTTHISPHERG
jgi:hypothetical protein